jgi:hypothetical protein
MAEFGDFVKELGGRIGPDYCPPSLSLLSKYWQDSEGRKKKEPILSSLTHSLIKHAPSSQWQWELWKTKSCIDLSTTGKTIVSLKALWSDSY